MKTFSEWFGENYSTNGATMQGAVEIHLEAFKRYMDEVLVPYHLEHTRYPAVDFYYFMNARDSGKEPWKKFAERDQTVYLMGDFHYGAGGAPKWTPYKKVKLRAELEAMRKLAEARKDAAKWKDFAETQEIIALDAKKHAENQQRTITRLKTLLAKKGTEKTERLLGRAMELLMMLRATGETNAYWDDQIKNFLKYANED